MLRCRTAAAERSGTLTTHILVGDVGGTHARFAVVDASVPPPWRIQHRLDLAEAFPTFTDALTSYFQRAAVGDKPVVAAIAVAGPVNAGTARFTNRGWEISESDLKQFGFKQAILVNDFEALAFAAEVLVDKDFTAIGPDVKGQAQGTVTILGPGTGFGVSCLARYGGRSVPMATEGGHMGFAPSDEAELAALQAMWKQKGRVSVERILSGSGLENLYVTLEMLAGRKSEALSAADISSRAMQSDPGCSAALTMFCSIFGSVAGDLALAHGSRGGVYIAGGITQKIQRFLVASPFRKRFEDKGRLSSFVQAVPTKLIVNPDVAMLGAARAGLTIARSP